MLIHREGFVTGIKKNKRSYDIYKNKSLIQNKGEFQNETITKNDTEATIQCINENCDIFVRKEQDGDTKFYKLCEYNGDDFLMTPEEVKQDIDNKELEKKLLEVNKRKKITSMEIQKANIIKDKLVIDKSNQDGLNDLIFFFLISLVVALLVYHAMRNRQPGISTLETQPEGGQACPHGSYGCPNTPIPCPPGASNAFGMWKP